AHADGVSQTYLVAAAIVQCGSQFSNDMGVHLALIRASQHTTDVTSYFDTILLCALENGPESLQTLCNGAIDVGLTELLAGGRKHSHFLGSRLQSLFVAFHVGSQHGVADAGNPVYALEHLGGVVHLRHPFG